MSLPAALVLGLLAGAAIGAVYFAWLWRTLQGLVGRGWSGPWFALHVALRLAVAAAGFGLVGRGLGWPGLAAALVGFVAARIVLLHRAAGPARATERRP